MAFRTFAAVLLLALVSSASACNECKKDTSFPASKLLSTTQTLIPADAAGSMITASVSDLADVTLAIFEIAPCESAPLHMHPRATEFAYVLEGQATATLLFENNTAYTAIAVANTGISFPSGLFHFVQNLQCTPLKFVAAFSCINPGTILIPPYLQAIPSNIETIEFTGPLPGPNTAAGFPFSKDAACMARCNYQSPSPMAASSPPPQYTY